MRFTVHYCPRCKELARRGENGFAPTCACAITPAQLERATITNARDERLRTKEKGRSEL